MDSERVSGGRWGGGRGWGTVLRETGPKVRGRQGAEQEGFPVPPGRGFPMCGDALPVHEVYIIRPGGVGFLAALGSLQPAARRGTI